jgi:hypothetical protein
MVSAPTINQVTNATLPLKAEQISQAITGDFRLNFCCGAFPLPFLLQISVALR